MVEASRILHQERIPSQPLPLGTMTLARHAATKAVKRELQARGIRPSEIELGDLAAMAGQWLTAHPELVEQAADAGSSWPTKKPRRRGHSGIPPSFSHGICEG
jgi:hypothetical protein